MYSRSFQATDSRYVAFSHLYRRRRRKTSLGRRRRRQRHLPSLRWRMYVPQTTQASSSYQRQQWKFPIRRTRLFQRFPSPSSILAVSQNQTYRSTKHARQKTRTSIQFENVQEYRRDDNPRRKRRGSTVFVSILLSGTTSLASRARLPGYPELFSSETQRATSKGRCCCSRDHCKTRSAVLWQCGYHVVRPITITFPISISSFTQTYRHAAAPSDTWKTQTKVRRLEASHQAEGQRHDRQEKCRPSPEEAYGTERSFQF